MNLEDSEPDCVPAVFHYWTFVFEACSTREAAHCKFAALSYNVHNSDLNSYSLCTYASKKPYITKTVLSVQIEPGKG